MAISIQEAAVYLALAQKHADATHREFALNMKANGRIKAFGVNDKRTDFDSRSAVINLLQGSGIDRNGGHVASSTPPTERDLGMGRLRGLAFIAYFDSTPGRGQDRGGGLWYRQRPGGDLSHAWGPPRKIKTLPQTIELPHIRGLHEKTNPAHAARDWYTKYVAPNPPPPPHTTSAPLNELRQTFTTANTLSHFVRTNTAFGLPLTLVAVPGGRANSDTRHQLFIKLAFAVVGEALARRAPNAAPFPAGWYPQGHSIGSVLRGANDQILWWGLNTNSEHGTLHGETNLIQTLQNLPAVNGDELPGAAAAGTRPLLYSTLEPCYMCAGMYQLSGQNIYCYYGQDDPGIVNNALTVANNQALLETSFGRMLAAASAIAPRIGVPAGVPAPRALSVTGFLNDEIRMLFLRALDQYITALPAAAGGDRVVWENGLRLLNHINPGVDAKWQARVDKYYAGVLP